ncbi:MAG: hypothetical protein AAGA17_05795 [Actinomycetota bacterium]
MARPVTVGEELTAELCLIVPEAVLDEGALVVVGAASGGPLFLEAG